MDPNRMDSPLVGKPAPHFSLKRLSDGTVVTLENLRGRPLLINFWSTWCLPCRAEHPVLLRGARHFGQRVEFISIVYQDRNEAVAAWLNRYGGQGYPTLIDEGTKTAIAYGVYGVPETYFIDSKGIIRDKHVGPLDFPRLAAYIARLK
jgi:cytochrome c biogenesis protein CcmG/thiol:disulfide interchange protein DsbE